jgi:cobalt-zinc-cadmium efflux system outer membrane protein
MFRFTATGRYALAALLAFAACLARAEDTPLTLRDALSRTLQSNPDLAVLNASFIAQRAREDAAALRPAPELQVQLENLLGSGSSRGLDAAEASFALSQVLELGGQRQRRMALTRERGNTLAIEREIAQLDVAAEVARRFIHVASDQKQLELTELATELARKTLDEVERRVQAARSPVAEGHRSRIALARAELEQEHAEHELLTSRRKLAAMWGASEPDFAGVRADLFRLPAAVDLEALSARLGASPDFLRFASEARRLDAEVRLAEATARASPTVSAGVRHSRDSDDTAFIAGLSLPLFGGRRARPEIAEAAALRDGVAAQRSAARIKAETTLYELVQELGHSIAAAEVLRDQVLPEMEAALKATEYAWQRGRYSYLEWTEAQRERIAVQRALIEAAANAHLFQTEIERLTGAAVSP